MKTSIMLMAVVALLAAAAGTAGGEAPDHAQNDGAGETARPEHAQDEHADEAGETARPEHAQDEHADEAGETAPPEHAQDEHADEAGETAPPEQAQNEREGETGPPEQAQNERSGADDEANEPNESAAAPRITLCHATASATKPYVQITVSANSITKQGHGEHQDGRDIIPPFEGYDGLNWDAEGQALFDDGCRVDVDDDRDNQGSDNDGDDRDNRKVTLCHATGSATNPYVMITVSENSITKQGHGEHQDGRDIIPPFEGYDGLNWDAEGQALFDDGCEIDDDGPDVEPDVEFTSVRAVCPAGSDDAVIRFDVSSDVDGDDVTVTLFDGDTEVATVEVDFDDDGADGFEASGEFAYPATVADGLTVSIAFGGGSASATVPAAPDCDDDGTGVLPDEEVPAPTGPSPAAPSPGDGTDVEGDEVVNVPVIIDRQTPNTPVQPVVRPVSTVTDTGPEVLGATVQRGALARTGSSMMLVPFGLGLVLLGFALRRSSRRAPLHLG